MEKDNSTVGAIVATTIIVGLVAFSLGASSAKSGSGSGDSSESSSTSEKIYTEDQYQEVVSCVKDANSRLNDINTDSGSVGDGDTYDDLVSALDDIHNNAETFCENSF